MPETLEQARQRRDALRYGSAKTTGIVETIIGVSIHEATGAVLPPEPDEQLSASDLDITKLELVGMRRPIGTKRKGKKTVTIYEDIKGRIEDSLLDAVVERTTDGASTLTLTVHDPTWAVVNSAIFDVNTDDSLDPVDVKLDKLWFRLVKVNPLGDTLTLVFEDREVALMRMYNKPRSVARSDKTRAQFVEMLVREVKPIRIKFYSPEKNLRQPIANAPKASTKVTKTKGSSGGRKRGIHTGQRLTVKHVSADAEQRSLIGQAIQIAVGLNAPHNAIIALLIACTQESDFHNIHGGGGSSTGLLQLIASWGSESFRRNVPNVIKLFLNRGFYGHGGAISIARRNPHMSPDQIAAQVQGNAAGARDYRPWIGEAESNLRAFGGGGGAGGGTVTTTTTRVTQYRFQRGDGGAKEDSWTCAQRLASEVNWRCFMRNGEVWFVSETWLLKQQVLAVIHRDSRGVESNTFTFDWDTGKKIQEVTFDIHADRWAFPPGSVIQLDKSGPANGRWITSRISKSLYRSTVTVTLTRAIQPKPEPAPETTTSTSTSGGGGGGASSGSAGGGTAVDKFYAEAIRISHRNYPYVWGGGHGRIGVPNGGGFDCSGYISACAHAAGWMNSPLVSGAFASGWGRPGRGKFLTVWANNGHVFAEFNGRHYHYADTSRQAGGPSGPHVRSGRRSTAGFTPRHWPGT